MGQLQLATSFLDILLFVFYIFKWLGEGGREPNEKEQDLLVTCENYMEFNFCKVYWNIAMLIASCIVCDYFCATVAKLNDGNRNSMACEARSMDYLALYSTSFPAPALNLWCATLAAH